MGGSVNTSAQVVPDTARTISWMTSEAPLYEKERTDTSQEQQSSQRISGSIRFGVIPSCSIENVYECLSYVLLCKTSSRLIAAQNPRKKAMRFAT